MSDHRARCYLCGEEYTAPLGPAGTDNAVPVATPDVPVCPNCAFPPDFTFSNVPTSAMVLDKDALVEARAALVSGHGLWPSEPCPGCALCEPKPDAAAMAERFSQHAMSCMKCGPEKGPCEIGALLLELQTRDVVIAGLMAKIEKLRRAMEV